MDLHQNVNSERLTAHIEALGQIGFSPRERAICRLALTQEERQAHIYIADQMRALGLQVRSDAIGNLIALLPGRERKRRHIMIGSHLDTVQRGGKYDGVVGVVAGLEILQVLRAAGHRPRHGIEVVAFAAEESARFNLAMIGSQLMVGLFRPAALERSKDLNGQSVISAWQELVQAERLHGRLETVTRDISKEIAAYLELHVEQGPFLARQGKKVGIVEQIAGTARFSLELTGQADHSGATPMDCRHDAGLAAARIACAVQASVCREFCPGSQLPVGTVGRLVVPGSMNVVPGNASMLIDIRDVDLKRRERIVRDVTAQIEAIQRETGVTISGTPVFKDPAVLSERMTAAVEEAAKSLGYPYQRMNSGAGHDAMNFNSHIPVGVIFVPSLADGRSHCYEEFSSPEDILIGTQVLLETLLDLDTNLE